MTRGGLRLRGPLEGGPNTHHFLLTPGRHPPPAWALGDRWGGGHQLSPASLPLSAGMKAPGKKTGLKPHLTVLSALGRPCPQEAG